jgi:hypothetical protein
MLKMHPARPHRAKATHRANACPAQLPASPAYIAIRTEASEAQECRIETTNSQVIPAEPFESGTDESEASRLLLAGKKSKQSATIRGISSNQPGVINVMRR